MKAKEMNTIFSHSISRNVKSGQNCQLFFCTSTQCTTMRARPQYYPHIWEKWTIKRKYSPLIMCLQKFLFSACCRRSFHLSLTCPLEALQLTFQRRAAHSFCSCLLVSCIFSACVVCFAHCVSQTSSLHLRAELPGIVPESLVSSTFLCTASVCWFHLYEDPSLHTYSSSDTRLLLYFLMYILRFFPNDQALTGFGTFSFRYNTRNLLAARPLFLISFCCSLFSPSCPATLAGSLMDYPIACYMSVAWVSVLSAPRLSQFLAFLTLQGVPCSICSFIRRNFL